MEEQDNKQNNSTQNYRIKRLAGYLHKLVPIKDEIGGIVQYVSTPLMVELRPRDIMQIIAGASLLAIPVGFTEEVWDLEVRYR